MEFFSLQYLNQRSSHSQSPRKWGVRPFLATRCSESSSSDSVDCGTGTLATGAAGWKNESIVCLLIVRQVENFLVLTDLRLFLVLDNLNDPPPPHISHLHCPFLILLTLIGLLQIADSLMWPFHI